jgi:IMP dehydrogenase/GMP reductase
MIGGMFAGCKEAPGERIGDKKIFRGMASKSAMLTIRSADRLPTAEGMVSLIDATDISATTVLEEMRGGLRSSLSYSNSRTIKEYHSNVEFGVRLNKI